MTAYDVYVASWACVFLLIFIALSWLLHTAYTKLDVILGHLSNCRAIQLRQPLFGRGPIGRLLMLGEATGIVRKPKLYLKNSSADPDDVKNFPPELKRLLVIQYNFIGVPVIAMFVLWGVGAYMGWLK